jgi:hypothetical protein
MPFNLNSDLLDSSTIKTLEDAFQNAYNSLTNFARRDDFIVKIQTAFGQAYDSAKVESLRHQWDSGDFSSLPNIEVRTGAELQGANAAYAGATNTIYFSQDFLNQYAGNVQVVAAVLIEEIGHSVDWKINTTDTPGDEGELFSALVRGVDLSQEQIQQMTLENDSVLLNLNGDLFRSEKSDPIYSSSNPIDPIALTRLLVFGAYNPSSPDYNSHIRSYQLDENPETLDLSTPKPASITYSGYDFMINGGGRYAYPSMFNVVEKFFGSNLDKKDGGYTYQDLIDRGVISQQDKDQIVIVSQYIQHLRLL